VIAEGFATAATIYEATSDPVAVTFNAGNLLAVAKALRKRYRTADIVLCADDDRLTEGNPGVTKAQEAARKIDGRVAIPIFPAGIRGTDFNDLGNEVGLDAVRQQILAAVELGIPANFKLSNEALYSLRAHKKEGGAIEIEEVPVCSRLEVVSLTRDSNGGEWGRLLQFRDPDGRMHEWAMPTEMLAGDGTEYRRRLWEQGLTIWPSRDARFALHEYISQCRPAGRARAVTRVGWHDNVFVLPDAVYGDTQGERTLYQSAVAIAHAFNMRGSLEDWQRNVAALCIDNSRLLFAVSVGFATALLHLTGDESGGFNYVGRSSVGKTTALRVGGSVWGGSQTPSGYLRPWRATANGLEGVAALHCDTVLCLDELSEVNAREAGNIAYMLANGQGKARAQRDGSARPAFEWRVLFLSSGEITLADKVREDERQRPTAGQQVRVLDIPADAKVGLGLFENTHGASNPQEFADRIRGATQNYYGSAARAFLNEIVREFAKVGDAIRGYRDDFIRQHCAPTADGQVRRAATRFGLVAAAGELASALGITGWPESSAASAAGVCFDAWLRYRGHVGPAEIEAGIEQVRTFFALHGESRFSKTDRDGDHKRPTVYDRAGFRKNGLYCMYPQVFRSDVARGFDWHLIADALVDRGMLTAGEDGKLQRKVRDPETGRSIRMLCFTPAILGIEDEAMPEFNATQPEAGQ
jgi:putative DNA primase/helicase